MRPGVTPSPVNPKPARWAYWGTSLLAATSAFVLPATRLLHAQASATIDMGASLVHYDGFLLSNALTITPTFSWLGSHAAVNARGTLLRFESGNRSLQGSVVGSVFTPPARSWRIEASGIAGASSYADFASFWHLLGEVRVRHNTDRGSIWLAATGGRTAFGSTEEARPVVAASINTMRRERAFVLVMTAGQAFVGDTQYSDIGMTARRQYKKIALEMLLAARFWSRGAGEGVYGEASGEIRFSDRWAGLISGGRYPSDPIRGSIAGRYVSAAVRFRFQPARPQVGPFPLPHSGANGGTDPTATTRLALTREASGYVRLLLQTPPASSVEIAGDFTDWQPMSLAPARQGGWEIVLRIPAGVHQINVRIDGGPWRVPGGTTRLVGDYDDEVGSFVVP